MFCNSRIIDLSLDVGQVMADRERMDLDISRLGHIGTHIDICNSPALPLEFFITEAWMIDIANLYDREIGLSDMNLDRLDIKSNQSVLFRTGWLAEKQYGNKIYFSQHPFFSWEVFDYLIARNVAIIGVDAPGMRRSVEHKLLDEYCVERGVYS